MEKIRLGISACLLGENVRYDGGHSHDRFLTDTLGRYFEYIPVCPEVEFGFPVPREAIRLEGDPVSPRLMKTLTREDITDSMNKWARMRISMLENESLCGFIFKSRSPSCGIERVKVHGGKGQPVKKGTGLFARSFMEQFPLIPVEDDGRLNDPGLRENFIERVFVLNRWRDLLKEKESRGRLTDFHTRHKMLILSHSTAHYQLSGRLIASAKMLPIKEVYQQYHSLLMESLRLTATPKKHSNVLMHMVGYFKKDLTPDEKQELLEVIDNYRTGHIPLIVPVTLIKHYVRKYDQPYLREQVYLRPHPLELQLRNHV
ncbi:MAG: DUF523 and DUF1722 domain-containing protein [Deltaproteobacteria bacterium]|nr:DUF523 and DUF1722 domain-containing protein [Deltaproteobacteria bacterium]